MSVTRISSRTVIRSCGAVLAGLVAIFLTTTAADAVLRATGVFPRWGQPLSDAQFLLASAQRVLFSILGCYLAARLAGYRPLAHALALGGIGVLISGVATIATWNMPGLGPHWYPIGLTVLSLPCAWLGGALRRRAA